jgi:hypothetical protein
MTANNELDTTIHEPSMTAGEVDMLLFALERSRAQFAWKVGGLDAAGLHQSFPPSTMTLAGLIKHLALVEDSKVAEFVVGEPIERARAAWARAIADGGLDQPSKFVWSGRSPNLRRILVDVHDEYARHVGHADLFREAIDGLVGEDPPQPG